MRLQKLIVVSILFCLPILSIPAASSALTITFQGCSPLVPCPAVCTMTVPGGVISIQVPVCDSNGSPTGAFFTIGSPDSAATIEAIRSADSHQISIQQLGITSNSTSQSTLTITATSDPVDFPEPLRPEPIPLVLVGAAPLWDRLGQI
jgi:hypothetical protein